VSNILVGKNFYKQTRLGLNGQGGIAHEMTNYVYVTRGHLKLQC